MSLDSVFKPKSVAILGASARKEKAGYKFAKAVLDAGYTGELFFTNPSGGEVFGRKIHKNLSEIGQEIDLALVQVARERISEVLEDSAAAGVKALILYTAGFSEADEQGARLQEELIDFTRKTGIRVVGPNCQGIFSASVGLDLTGSGTIPPGNIGMISQSGGLGSHAWYEAANNLRVGFSRFVSIGNQADIPVHEYLEYMGDDPDTHAVVLYLEGLKAGTGRAFVEAARKVALKKPVIAIKGGQTKSGQRAANSHTGSMVGEGAVVSAAFREAGVIEVSDFEDLLPVAQTLLLCEPLQSEKIALVGFGGGHSTLSADALEKAGFEIPTFSAKTDARLRELLPYWAPRKNPIDLAGGYLQDLTVWVGTMRAALEEEGIGGALIYGPWAAFMPELKTGDTDWKEVSRQMAALQKEYGKPILACSHTGRGNIYQNDELRAGGVPMFDRIDTAATAFTALRTRGQWLTRNCGELPFGKDVKPSAETALPVGVANLTEAEAYDLVGSNGVPVALHEIVSSPAAAAKAASRLGYPVVMKICSREIVHKSDVHGVITAIETAAQAEAAFADLRDRAGRHGVKAPDILVAKQVSGLELIVGYVRDAHFGPTVIVGMGGIMVEILKDVAIRLAPVSHNEAKDMLAELKASPLLFGARNQKPLDTDAVAEIIVSVSELGASAEKITEIDLNPIFVTAKGAQAADARVILSQTH